ncbi:MAG: hypothetical protein AAF465_09125 [Pseudomonadota bacterium]
MPDNATSQVASAVATCADLPVGALEAVVRAYGVALQSVPSNAPILGSYWGDREAGLVGNTLYVRADTPVHSALHELCHYVCMPASRRASLDTNAGGDYDEENGVCYLQIVLSDTLEGFDRAHMLRDMDAWGYTFRLGSAGAWFEHDADDACAWLQQHGVIDAQRAPTGSIRD